MLPGDSADDQKTCICMGDSRANVGGSWMEAATKLRFARRVGHELAHIQRSGSKLWFESKIRVDAGAGARSGSIWVFFQHLVVCGTWCFTLKEENPQTKIRVDVVV